VAASRKIHVTETGVPIPEGLQAPGRELFVRIATDYDLAGSFDKLVLLEQAARTADVVARLQQFVDASEQLRSTGSMRQAVALPELVELRQFRAQYASLIKQLGCESDGDAAERERGPKQKLSRSEVGRLGARVRWNN
jgi:hypothetical protein